ncbi:MAG: hypothetical protein MRJ92_11085 [Nitrospira sp.]|nr:hypothetical protein [Nitrospira sp.]
MVLQEEISAHLDSRSFGKVLTDLKAQHRRRAVILKNNQVETVIVPVDDYEKMAGRSNSWSTLEIHRLLTQRAREKAVTLESLLKEQRRAIDPQRLSDHQLQERLVEVVAIGKREDLAVYQKARKRFTRRDREKDSSSLRESMRTSWRRGRID